MRRIKKIISVMLILAMMLTFAPMSKAVYVVTGNYSVTIPVSGYEEGKAHYNCWEFAKTIYQKIWGTSFSSYRGTSDDMLRNIGTGNARALTADNTRKFITAAPLGSVIRISAIIDGNDAADTLYQHSQILIQKDSNGFTVYEGNIEGKIRIKYFTWSSYASAWANWKYFKYIKYPNATAFTETTYNYSSISTGYYTLTNIGSGKILDVAGGVDADQTNIQGGDWWNPSNQRLYISSATTGYKMKPVCSSRLVNAWGDNPGNGANVNIYKDCNESSQWWLFEKVTDGYVVHLAYNPSLVLTYWASSNNVAIATYASGDTRQIWKLDPSNQFTVSYNANGGTGAPASQTMYQGRESALSSTVPTRSGYTFNGWNTKADGTGTAYSSGGTIVLNSNATLYAQWKSDSYTLTYNANGGTGAPSSQTANKNSTVTVSSVTPSMDGCEFFAWNTKADGEGVYYYPGDSITMSSDITLYANWSRVPYTVDFDPNGGDVSPDSFGTTSDNPKCELPTPTKYVTITYNANGGKNAPSATKAYYECLGWSKSSTATTATYKCGEQYNITGGETLYAVWANKAYTDLSSSVPTRDGYNFLGWATSSSATKAQFAPGINVNLGIDTVLYAVWQKIETPKPEPTPPTVTYENVSLNYKDSMTFNVPVTLETSNSGVASVSGNKISAVGTGSADVTATFADGSKCVYHVNVSYTWWQWIIVIVLFGWIWY